MYFTRKTIFADYIKVLERVGACAEALTWCKSIDAEIKDCTFGDGIDALEPSEWAVWCLTVFYEKFNDEVRAGFLRLIKDPMQSLQMCCNLPLSVIDEATLKEIYEGKLPTAEKELADGVIFKDPRPEPVISEEGL